MVPLTEKTIGEILEYLERSVTKLGKEMINLESQGNFEEFEYFISNQFDIRLENILKAKNSSIHHLESKMKNMVIQRKNMIIDRITKQMSR